MTELREPRPHKVFDLQFRRFTIATGTGRTVSWLRFLPIHVGPVWTSKGDGWKPWKWCGIAVGSFLWFAYAFAFSWGAPLPRQRWVKVLRE